MQLKPEQLPAHLKRGLAPVYVISGDEPLQTDEALGLIGQSAHDLGFTERVVLQADARFDWDIINQYADSPSLFGEKRLLDVRIVAGGGPGQQGSRALMEYASRPSPHQVLRLITGQMDAKQRKSKWYQSLDRAGACIALWPVTGQNLPRWIETRLRGRGMTITEEAVGILAQRMEGNLLACAQEIEKLILVCQTREIGLQDVLQSVVDSAHFDTFGLVESTLAGDAGRTARILSGLWEEGTEPLPVLGVLIWEIREVIKMAHQVAGGASLEGITRQQPAWRRRSALLARALDRQGPTAWMGMLRVAGRVDQIIKGARRGDPREALLALGLLMSGVEIPFPDAGPTADAIPPGGAG
uniref:DNA polymerase III subunit delta n=1 Tax=Candidatus Kentrum eta TaxID=2126337 RepID=A0A450UUE6_9GAMM|nr:MAG: DNA polymerase III, delta subunit [Candidatus Kentron sp. H]VFJ89503.1 MAG: DNA polymerase III, delta subunit [Candidatus Kentron sp. H]VFJ96157.1 MAG: DNA polymerase III, delta subunit [Candidatus Kentron sp. H]